MFNPGLHNQTDCARRRLIDREEVVRRRRFTFVRTMEVRRYESTLDNQFDTHLMSSDRRASLVSLSSTADTSSYESAPQEQDEYQRQSPPSLSTKTSMSSNDYDNWRPDSDAGSSRDGLGRSQSFTESSRAGNTRRREKAAVGFACLNCKKAHLACDGEFFNRGTSAWARFGEAMSRTFQSIVYASVWLL